MTFGRPDMPRRVIALDWPTRGRASSSPAMGQVRGWKRFAVSGEGSIFGALRPACYVDEARESTERVMQNILSGQDVGKCTRIIASSRNARAILIRRKRNVSNCATRHIDFFPASTHASTHDQ